MAGITKVIDDAKVLLVANDEPSRSTAEQVRMNNLVCMLRNKLAEVIMMSSRSNTTAQV